MDYIEVYDDKNNKKKMEVVTTFQLENRDFNYIVYRELDGSRTYLAKYKDNVDELNTNISETELKLCEAIVNGVIE